MAADDTHERYDIPDADVLFEDTWADDDPAACEKCGAVVPEGATACPECGARLPRCVGACSACVSPRCVGDGRGRGR